MNAASLFGGLGLTEGLDHTWRDAATGSERKAMYQVVRSWIIRGAASVIAAIVKRSPGARMLLLPGCALALVFVVQGSATAENDSGWVGKRVVQKQVAFALKIGDQNVNRKSRIEIYRVIKVQGPWLWLEATGLAGWALATDIVPVEQAIDYFTQQARANPKDIHAYTMRAIIWQSRNEHDIALGDYTEAIRVDPTQAWLHNNRAHLWNTRREHDKAIIDSSEAIRLDPKEPMAYHNRAVAWGEKGEHDKAIADYNEAIRLDPRNPLAYHNRGASWVKTKEYDKAIADYNEAIRLDPHFAHAFTCRGTAWWAKKQIDKALADYNEAIRLDSKEPLAFSNRAYVWGARKQYEKAIADFDEAIRLDARFVQAQKGRDLMLSARAQAMRDDARAPIESPVKTSALTVQSAEFGTAP